jgi:peptide/nickel transport system substrate-binding protein
MTSPTRPSARCSSGPAGIKRVLIKTVPDWGVRLAMFRKIDVDHIYVPTLYYPQLQPCSQTVCDVQNVCRQANPDGFILAYNGLPIAGIFAGMFNWQINVIGDNPYDGSGKLDGNGVPPDFFQDLHVRRALSYCFDYQTFIEDAMAGEGRLAQGSIPVGMMGHLEGEAPLYTYDPARCEEEFKLADVDRDGIPAGEDEDDVWNLGFYMQVGCNVENATRRLASEILKGSIKAVNLWLMQGLARIHFQSWIKGFYYNPAYSIVAYAWIYPLSKEAP